MRRGWKGLKEGTTLELVMNDPGSGLLGPVTQQREKRENKEEEREGGGTSK